MSETKERAKVDLSQGIAASALSDGGMILGQVGKDDVVLARSGNEFFAVRAQCSHFRGPLVEGIVVGDTVRCPWHHACFSLRTGEALRAPAVDQSPAGRWSGRATRSSSRKSFRRRSLPPLRSPRASRQLRSSSSGAEPREWLQPRC